MFSSFLYLSINLGCGNLWTAVSSSHPVVDCIHSAYQASENTKTTQVKIVQKY